MKRHKIREMAETDENWLQVVLCVSVWGPVECVSARVRKVYAKWSDAPNEIAPGPLIPCTGSQLKSAALCVSGDRKGKTRQRAMMQLGVNGLTKANWLKRNGPTERQVEHPLIA